MTTPIYLVRHAKAGNRLRWTQPDELRPLTKPGRGQAEALVTLLADQPFSRLLSSPHMRCVQTLEPLAKARDLPLETTELLAEGASISAVLELMLSIADGGPSAFSTHGDVMTGVVLQLLVSGIAAEGAREFKKGSTWILDVENGAISGARYLPPPIVGIPPDAREA